MALERKNSPVIFNYTVSLNLVKDLRFQPLTDFSRCIWSRCYRNLAFVEYWRRRRKNRQLELGWWMIDLCLRVSQKFISKSWDTGGFLCHLRLRPGFEYAVKTSQLSRMKERIFISSGMSRRAEFSPFMIEIRYWSVEWKSCHSKCSHQCLISIHHLFHHGICNERLLTDQVLPCRQHLRVEGQIVDESFAIIRCPTDTLIDQGFTIDQNLNATIHIVASIGFDIHMNAIRSTPFDTS